MTSSVRGFFSYSHLDDSHGNLTRLKNDICTEYQMITGTELDLFFDRESIDWGDLWQDSITSNLDQAMFFIPILNPCYFNSSSCQMEIRQYLDKTKEWNAEELLLPLLYIDFKNEFFNVDAELSNAVLERQYIDIRALRFVEPDSAEYLKHINTIAEKIFAANIKLTAKSQDNENATGQNPSNNQSTNGSKGFFLDSFANLDPKFSSLTRNTEQIVASMNSITECVERRLVDMNALDHADPKYPNLMLNVAQALASDLRPVAQKYHSDSIELLNGVNDVAPDVKTLLRWFKEDSENKRDGEAFFDQIRQISTVSSSVRRKLFDFKDSTQPIKTASRVLFVPFSSIEHSTEICIQALDEVASWGFLLQ